MDKDFWNNEDVKDRKWIYAMILLVLVIIVLVGTFAFKDKIFKAKDEEHSNTTQNTNNTSDDDYFDNDINKKNENKSTENEEDIANETSSSLNNEKKDMQETSKLTHDKETQNNQTETVGSADSSSTFTEKSFKTTEGINLKYWLYTPQNATSNMPLILYLHGGSGKGNDLNLVVKDGFPKYLKNGELGNINSYVVIPQLPSNYKGWSDIKVSIRDLITNIKNIYNINTNKISITGHSMGGKGTYDIALAYPNLFSCVAPMSGSIKLDNSNIEKLKNIPVWAFVGANDTIVEPSSSTEFINSLKQVNNQAKLTIFDGAGHFDVPELGYKNTDVINWLINNSK